MIALDVDGTIAGLDHKVSEITRSAIKAAVESGAIVVIATGRMRRSAVKYAQMCETNGPVISYGGAWSIDSDHVSDIHHERLPESVAGMAIERMRSTEAHINAYIDDEIFVESPSKWAEAYALRMGVQLRTVSSLDQVIADGPTIVMAVDDPEKMTALSTNLRTDLGNGAAVTQTLPRFCEVASSMAQKHVALDRIATSMGISASEVIAAGDGPGDVSMLRWAGHSVSVDGAHADAITEADTIVAGPEQDGIAGLIRDLLSQGKLGA